ncbi:hypothetical protein [Pseudomonas sp. PSKL.D1]|uniref:hypothetical protein n=1 Tax=Pseudomonas sp. PSKL.D1 TaxID=3029060 RepID=UPI002380D930|nr:hypothetical protein [Pseudomonas sp. PSKL.D1]WDY60367.1 hypothetical protein PVV54_12295 [Pseudomonas sp. PSKL.D1]
MTNKSNISQFPRRHAGDNGYDGTGGGGGGSELEARVAKLESHIEYMRRDIADLKAEAKMIGSDVSELKVSAKSAEVTLANITSHMVTKGQLAVWALIGLTAVTGSVLGGLWWLAQQYLSPIMKTLGQ